VGGEGRRRRELLWRPCGSRRTQLATEGLTFRVQLNRVTARGWREADSVWQRRASVVAFANLSRKGDQNLPGFTEMVLDNCSHLLGSQERFAQTSVGWVLRKLSRSDQGRVIGFVEANLDRFSREALKKATKFSPPEVAERLLQAHLPSGNRSHRR
jgi:3-methyladenine DNA glycosylase AlkD